MRCNAMLDAARYEYYYVPVVLTSGATKRKDVRCVHLTDRGQAAATLDGQTRLLGSAAAR